MIPVVAERASELPEICQRYHVARLDLYGKAATADSLTEHDSLSLLVDFQFLPLDNYFDMYFGLLESLEELFGLPVELATTEAMATNPFFPRSLIANKVKLYGA